MKSLIRRHAIPLEWGCILALLAAVLALAVPHYTQKLFHLDGHKYRSEQSADAAVTYYPVSSGLPEAAVTTLSGRKEIRIGDEVYRIEPLRSHDYSSRYVVSYPDGREYQVEAGRYGTMMIFNAQGEWIPGGITEVNGVRIREPGEPDYNAAELLTAAYPEYHTTEGEPLKFGFSLLMMLFGYSTFRFESFRMLQFKLSYSLMTENAEPSELYLFLSRWGGLLVMAASLWLAADSL